MALKGDVRKPQQKIQKMENKKINKPIWERNLPPETIRKLVEMAHEAAKRQIQKEKSKKQE